MPKKRTKHTVMIVDDSPVMREILRDILTAGGYTIVAEAADGAEAVLVYEKFKPELTIMDVLMPVDDGLKATRNIIALNRHAKVVMCSSITDEALIMSAHKAGACGIILKPFVAEQALEVLATVMQE